MRTDTAGAPCPYELFEVTLPCPCSYQAKFKASYAESRLSLMCNISAVGPQQNVTGRCQEIQQTLPLHRFPLGLDRDEPVRAKNSNFIHWHHVTFLKAWFLRNKVRLYRFGIWSQTEASIHLLPLLLLQVCGETIKRWIKHKTTTRGRFFPLQFLSETCHLRWILDKKWFDMIIMEQIPTLNQEGLPAYRSVVHQNNLTWECDSSSPNSSQEWYFVSKHMLFE